MRQCSLRVRLLRFLLIPVALAYIITGFASYYSAYHEAEEIYDAQLAHFAKVLRELSQLDIQKSGGKDIRIDTRIENLHEYEKHFAYRVWKDESVILYSSNAKDFGPLAVSDGFVERIIGDEHWRFFILRDNNLTVEVAERYEVRIDLIHHILGGIFLPQLLIIPSLALILWLGVIGGLRPLTVLSGLIRNRSPQNLQPIEVPVVPFEVVPVVDAVNDLIQRVDRVLEYEKQFSNYAAHELRTPLAALKTQLQVALRTEDKVLAEEMFRELLPSIDRMQHLVEQLLMLVRIKSSDNLSDIVPFSSLCQDTLKEMAPLAIESDRVLESCIDPDLSVLGNRQMLVVMLNNLVSNGLKYTAVKGRVLVTVYKNSNRLVLCVQDDGIGITEKDCAEIFNSFYRVAGTGVEGCGLGLAIVKRIVDLHQGSIKIIDGLEGKGVGFQIEFDLVSD